MLIELANPNGDPGRKLHGTLLISTAKWAEERLGDINPISLHRDDDGTLTLKVMTGSDGEARMSYTRHPDGTITMTKWGKPHQGVVSGHGEEPLRDLTEEITQEITGHLAAGENRRTLAQTLTDSRSRNEARGQIFSCGSIAAINSIAPCEFVDQDNRDLRPAINDALVRTVAKHITDKEVTNLLNQPKKRGGISDVQYNLLQKHRAQFLKLQDEEPEILSYHLSHTWTPETLEPPATTTAGLQNAVATALDCSGAARRVLLDGFGEKLWAKLQPSDVSRICRTAGRIPPASPGRDRPSRETVNAVRELRKAIPDPRSIESAREHRYYAGGVTEDAERAEYWLAVLTIYERDHDPEQAANDLEWLKKTASAIGRQRHTPGIPEAGEIHWARLRRY